MKSFIDELTPKQEKRYKKFIKKHKPCHDSVVGGKISYIQTPTGLGVLLAVRCNTCNKESILNMDDLN